MNELARIVEALLFLSPDPLSLDAIVAATNEDLEDVREALAELEEIVATSDKRRFELSDDGKRIRATQGHSVPVDLGYEDREPPELLYHGTAERNLGSILAQGLRSGQRHAVHLSTDVKTAIAVGQRYGKPVVLVVQAGRMHLDGHRFQCSSNGVWLTEHVPVEYLSQEAARP